MTGPTLLPVTGWTGGRRDLMSSGHRDVVGDREVEGCLATVRIARAVSSEREGVVPRGQRWQQEIVPVSDRCTACPGRDVLPKVLIEIRATLRHGYRKERRLNPVALQIGDRFS